MSDISAAFVLHYLDRFNDIITKHDILYKKYYNLLQGLNGIEIMIDYSDKNYIPFTSCFPIIFKSIKIDKKHIEYFKNHDIEVKKYYKPLLLKGKANEIYEHILCLPLNCDMNEQDIERIYTLLIELS